MSNTFSNFSACQTNSDTFQHEMSAHSSEDDHQSILSDSCCSVVSNVSVSQKSLEENMVIAWTSGLSYTEARSLFSKIASARATRLSKITNSVDSSVNHDTKSKKGIVKRIYLMESRFLSIIASLFSYMVICQKSLASSHLKCLWDEKGNKCVTNGMEKQFSQMQHDDPDKFGNICSRLITNFICEYPDQKIFGTKKKDKHKLSLDDLRMQLTTNLKKKLKIGTFSYETYIENGKQTGMMVEHKQIFLQLHLHVFLNVDRK